LSPQSRRGHAGQPSHRKPAPRVPTDAARKPATTPTADAAAAARVAAETASAKAAADAAAAEVRSAAGAASAVTPKSATGASPSSIGKVARGKAGSRPTERKAAPAARRGRGLVRVGRSSTARNIYSYLKAYIPVFIAFAIIFAGVWAWSSFGPHTNTPKENWTKIESTWKPKRAADFSAVSVAIAANDFTATVNGYKTLSGDTKGWMDELAKITSWDDAAASANPGGTATQFVQQLVTDGSTEVAVLDQVAAAKSINDVLALKDQLDGAEQTFQADLASAPTIFGVAAAPSGEPTLALPSGSLSPSGSPSASSSSSAGSSESPTVSPTASPS